MRRIGLYASTLSLLVMLVAACGAPAVAPVEEAAPTAAAPAEAAPAPAAEGSADAAAPGEYHEAPQLAELVAAGQLPPVAERVSSEPLIVTDRKSVV